MLKQRKNNQKSAKKRMNYFNISAAIKHHRDNKNLKKQKIYKFLLLYLNKNKNEGEVLNPGKKACLLIGISTNSLSAISLSQL